MAQITAIVVSYNSHSHLLACLNSVVEQREVLTEIVVVDNASTDHSADLVLSQFPEARLIVNKANRGFASAVNQGLVLATGEFVLLLNPDAVLLPGALARLLAFLETHPQVAAVGPRQWLDTACTWQRNVVPWPPHWQWLLSGLPGLWRLGMARRRLVAHWTLNRAIWRDDHPQVVPYLSGACLLLRREALKVVGGLDEGYFLFFEDTDLCDRLRAAGWTLHAVPSAGVVHVAQGSVSTMPDSGQGYLLSSGRRYLARHGDLPTRVLWGLLQSRRARKALSAKPFDASKPLELTLRWTPATGVTDYWIELSPDPVFLYAAASQVPQPACSVPEELPIVTTGRRFFWRVAPVDAEGRLGQFTRYTCRRLDVESC